MICPDCGGETKVIDSREVKDYCRRRRKCLKCRARYSTKETFFDFKKGRGFLTEEETKKEKLINELIVEYMKGLSADELDRLYEKL